jgi:hypothetical protein
MVPDEWFRMGLLFPTTRTITFPQVRNLMFRQSIAIPQILPRSIAKTIDSTSRESFNRIVVIVLLTCLCRSATNFNIRNQGGYVYFDAWNEEGEIGLTPAPESTQDFAVSAFLDFFKVNPNQIAERELVLFEQSCGAILTTRQEFNYLPLSIEFVRNEIDPLVCWEELERVFES